MGVIEILTLIATFSTISGIDIRSLLKLKIIKKQPEAFGIPLIKLLSIFQEDHEITGLWDIFKWDYYKKENGEFKKVPCEVWGELAILYKIPNKFEWKGVMVLHYDFVKTKNPLRQSIEKVIGKFISSNFVGIYKIVFNKKDGYYAGTSSMILRIPWIKRKFYAEFPKLILNDKNNLSGVVFSSRMTSKADVIFSQRKDWSEITEFR